MWSLSRALEKGTDKVFALKRLLTNHPDNNVSTYLENISTLLKLEHPNIINIRGVVVGRDPKISEGKEETYVFMDYAEHSLTTLIIIERYQFPVPQVQPKLSRPALVYIKMPDPILGWIATRYMMPSGACS